MPTVSATRLRVRASWFVPPFLLMSLRAKAQAEFSPGFLGGALVTDTGRVYWTVTIWETEDAMRAYRNGGVHAKAMRKVASWCDEAAVATWSQDGKGVPSAQELSDGLVAQARFTRLPRPSRAHAAGKAMPLTERGRIAMRPRVR